MSDQQPDEGVRITVGQHIQVRMGGNANDPFEVTRVEEQRFTARSLIPAGPGRKWAFNRLPHGAHVIVDDSLVCTVAGGSGSSVRLKPIGRLPTEAEKAEKAEKETR